jgi:6-phosphofructokinase
MSTVVQFAGKYSALCTTLGYQTRSALPSIFDANLGFTMGQYVVVVVLLLLLLLKCPCVTARRA